MVREAAACDLASVLITGSCAAEDVADGENGFCIEENAQALAAILTQLCQNPVLMAQVGRRAGEDLYMSWQTAVSQAFDRYQIVMDRCSV